MSDVKKIIAPFGKDVVRSLKAGDNVLISGTIIAARDAAHKKLTQSLAKGEKLPIDFKDQVIYYVGPTPAIPGNPIGSAGPTTSGRMDKYTPTMLDIGVSAMIGKGYRSEAVVESMKKNCVVYMVAIGGTGALISQSIKSYEVLAYEELGPEAVARIEVVDFPAIVAIDCEGNDFYKQGQAPFKEI